MGFLFPKNKKPNMEGKKPKTKTNNDIKLGQNPNIYMCVNSS